MSKEKSGDVVLTQIKEKKGRLVLLFDDGEKIKLPPDVFSEFHFGEGDKLSESDYARLTDQAEYWKYWDYCCDKLSRESYSTYQIKTKLIGKGVKKEHVTRIIARLKEAKLLDDSMFARTFAEDVGDLRNLGKNRIIYELRLKGIHDDIIAKLVFPEEKEYEKACRLASFIDRRYSRYPTRKKRLKAMKVLFDHGFDDSVSGKAVAAMITDTEKTIEEAGLSHDYELCKAKYARKYEGYELKRHILMALLRKGYEYDDIERILEEENL